MTEASVVTMMNASSERMNLRILHNASGNRFGDSPADGAGCRRVEPRRHPLLQPQPRRNAAERQRQHGAGLGFVSRTP